MFGKRQYCLIQILVCILSALIRISPRNLFCHFTIQRGRDDCWACPIQLIVRGTNSIDCINKRFSKTIFWHYHMENATPWGVVKRQAFFFLIETWVSQEIVRWQGSNVALSNLIFPWVWPEISIALLAIVFKCNMWNKKNALEWKFQFNYPFFSYAVFAIWCYAVLY